MALIRELIESMREELSDLANPPRFTEAHCLRALSKAARRAQALLHRHNIELGRTAYVFTTEPGLDEYFLPGDFQSPDGLYWPGVREIALCPEAAFTTARPLPELSRYLIRGDTLVVQGAPSRAVELHLLYWPRLDTASWGVDDETPWSGRLDDLLTEYACLRLRNIDEEDVSLDLQLKSDLETGLLALFAARSPVAGRLPGWL
jgi:hypothetical protein